MRVPMRSEPEAFRLAVAAVAAIGVAVLVGWLVEPVAGAALFGAFVVAGLVAYLRAGNPDRRAALREAARAPHPHGAGAGKRHVLVVANEVLGGAELRGRLHRARDEGLEVDVLAPVLTSHVHYGVSDIDEERAQARERLERSLEWTREAGIPARGEIGDPNPLTAIEDELRDFGPDEVIVVTRARDRESWQERGELERLRVELDVPVVHVTVDGEGAAPSPAATTAPPAGT
jgi:hypothetical protein